MASSQPGYTYILSYVPGTGRHAVYVDSLDQKTRTLCCINSWGNIDPTPRVSLDNSGNILYRVFCTTFVVLTSTGPSTQWQGSRLGVFEYLQQHNNCPAYRQRHTVANTQPGYLYKDDGGAWCVGPVLGESSLRGLLNRTKSDTVPSTNWLRADGKGGWPSDPMLTVSTSLPSVCPAIKISLHGAAARAQPGSGGEFRHAGDWSAGHPVYSNGHKYLCVKPGKTVWGVTYSLDSKGGGLQSGSVTWCPADDRAAISQRLNRSSWQYGDHSGWHDMMVADMEILTTCSDF